MYWISFSKPTKTAANVTSFSVTTLFAASTFNFLTESSSILSTNVVPTKSIAPLSKYAFPIPSSLERVIGLKLNSCNVSLSTAFFKAMETEEIFLTLNFPWNL